MSGSGPSMMVYYKEAIKKNMDTIAEYIKVDEVLGAMFSSSLINRDEYQIIGSEGRSKGSIAEARLLLEIVLDKENRQMEEFVGILRDNRNEIVADLIDDTMKKMWNGEMRSNITSLK